MKKSKEFKTKRVLKLLCNPTRGKILQTLERNKKPLNVNAICSKVGVVQPTVSNQLSILRDIGIVNCKKESVNKFYTLNREMYGLFTTFTKEFEKHV